MGQDPLGRALGLGLLGRQDVRADLVGGQAHQAGRDLDLLLDIVGEVLRGGDRLVHRRRLAAHRIGGRSAKLFCVFFTGRLAVFIGKT